MATGHPEHELLEAEYEREPVPIDKRRSLGSVSAVWFGFPMILTNAVFGGIIAYSLGFWPGIGAIVLGNAVLFVYVGSLSYLAGETGLNFAMQAKRTFGQYGYAFVSAFLASIVVGWYAFQTGLTGATVHASFGWPTFPVTLFAAILYTAITFIGVRALSIIGLIAAPLYLVLGVVALVLIASDHSLAGIFSYSGSSGASAITFGAAITLVVATFADSGTMTSDFTRWSKDGRAGVAAAFTAFPVANMVAQIFGIIVVAAGAASEPASNGGNFMHVLTSHGPLLTTLALVFVFVNLGSVCTHCLYNGAIGWAHLSGKTMRTLTILLGIIGGIAALAGVWGLFLDWLNLLGIFVPPIGAVMIVDQLMLRRGSLDDTAPNYRPNAFLAWAVGSVAGLLVHSLAPGLSEAICGLIAAGLAYAGVEVALRSRVQQGAA